MTAFTDSRTTAETLGDVLYEKPNPEYRDLIRRNEVLRGALQQAESTLDLAYLRGVLRAVCQSVKLCEYDEIVIDEAELTKHLARL